MDGTHRGKRDEKIPAAADAAAKVPKKKGRKVKPKGNVPTMSEEPIQ
jgi:hypothetical protein